MNTIYSTSDFLPNSAPPFINILVIDGILDWKGKEGGRGE
jgi:hypothetical protein